MPKQMEDWQLQRLRDGLNGYRALGDKTGASSLSWPDIEADIEFHTDVSVTVKRLSKFAIGEPHPDKQLKALGVRKYSRLIDERLNAVVDFLTNPVSPGYMFPLEDLNIYSDALAPLRLMEYLNGDRDIERRLSPPALAGVFAARQYIDAENINWWLRLRSADYQGLIPCVVLTAPSETEILPEITPANLAELAGVVRYRGWAVLTPEENLILLLQKERNGENLWLLSLAIDAGIYHDRKVNGLVLLAHDYPEDSTVISINDDVAKARQQVTDALQERLLAFYRADKNDLPTDAEAANDE